MSREPMDESSSRKRKRKRNRDDDSSIVAPLDWRVDHHSTSHKEGKGLTGAVVIARQHASWAEKQLPTPQHMFSLLIVVLLEVVSGGPC